MGRDLAVASERTVMVIACPHALGLAVRLVVAVSTALAAGNGLLILANAPSLARVPRGGPGPSARA